MNSNLQVALYIYTLDKSEDLPVDSSALFESDPLAPPAVEPSTGAPSVYLWLRFLHSCWCAPRPGCPGVLSTVWKGHAHDQKNRQDQRRRQYRRGIEYPTDFTCTVVEWNPSLHADIV